MNAQELDAILHTQQPLFECAPAAREGVRVRTPFMYPDGGMIDVFVLSRDGRLQITDFGEALGCRAEPGGQRHTHRLGHTHPAAVSRLRQPRAELFPDAVRDARQLSGH